MAKVKLTKKRIIVILSLILLSLALFGYFYRQNDSEKIQTLNTEQGIKYYSNSKQLDMITKPIILNAIQDTQIKNNPNKALPLKGFSETVPILMYHYVEIAPASSTLKGLYLDPKIFASQLEELQKNNYQTLFVSDVAESVNNKNTLDNKKIVLTFDDGYEDFYTEAFPLLKKYNAKATLYVIINALGTKGYLTREQVKELADSGLVEIGSHTFNHPDLRSLKSKDLIFEIEASKRILENISGKPVLSFAYPFGLYKTDFFKLVSETPYLSAVSVIPGTRQGEENNWILRRIRPNDREGEAFIKWIKEWEKSAY